MIKYLKKHWWDVILVCALILGFVFGILGFVKTDETNHKLGNALYESFRLFDLKYASKDISPNLISAQWFLFFALLWLSLKVIITIIAPDLLSNIRVLLFYRKHIVICGLSKTTSNLVNEYKGKKIIILAEECNKYSESLKQKGVKLFFCGNSFDEHFLQLAKIRVASQLFVVTDDDKKNVEITKLAFSLLKKASGNHALKCYTMIKDRELQNLLEESSLFKYRTETFDSTLFNVNETGIKYGLSLNIEKILPEKTVSPPEILMVGLSEKSEIILLNLAHCLTMNREVFHFTIVESDTEKITLFEKKYPYLQDFVKMEYANDLEKTCKNKQFTSIFVCLENQIDAVKAAVSIRYTIAAYSPNIFIFSGQSEDLVSVMNIEDDRITTLKDRNIFMLNTFEETIQYIVKLDSEIETLAEAAHNHFRKKDDQGNFLDNDEYSALSSHFKQTNRNQVLDFYILTYMATGEKFSIKEVQPVAFSKYDKETLAMMEHRRWMIEKYDNGWVYGERNNQFKRQDCLIEWERLPENQQSKDFDVIDLMMDMLKNLINNY